MGKRPTPKKRKAKSAGRRQHSVYILKEVRRFQERQNSPYSVIAPPKNKEKKALKGITRVKA
jgi:hypothetical protein